MIMRFLFHLPIGKLKELVYGGKIITSGAALNLGLIEKVVPKGQVMTAALELASKIKGKVSYAIAAAKKVINRARDFPSITDWI